MARPRVRGALYHHCRLPPCEKCRRQLLVANTEKLGRHVGLVCTTAAISERTGEPREEWIQQIEGATT
jgi:hypothetical protein